MPEDFQTLQLEFSLSGEQKTWEIHDDWPEQALYLDLDKFSGPAAIGVGGGPARRSQFSAGSRIVGIGLAPRADF